jgi:hypothetical protein
MCYFQSLTGQGRKRGDVLSAVIVPSVKYNYRTNKVLNEFNKKVKLYF